MISGIIVPIPIHSYFLLKYVVDNYCSLLLQIDEEISKLLALKAQLEPQEKHGKKLVLKFPKVKCFTAVLTDILYFFINIAFLKLLLSKVIAV